MVAEIQRLEDAARVAMGDHSYFGGQTATRAPTQGSLAATAAKVFAALGRAVGKPIA